MKHSLKAIIYDKRGRVLSVGQNSYVKSHTVMAKHANKVGLPEKIYLHAEAVVVSVTQDKNGDGVLLCQAINGKQIGVQFECLMRKDADPEVNYRKYSNALLLIGKAITYEYEELSDKGVPTKPVSVALREMIGNEGRY